MRRQALPQIVVGQRIGQRRRRGGRGARDVLDGPAGAEQVGRRAPVGNLEMAGRVLARRQRHRGRARMGEEKERRPGAARLHRLKQVEEVPRAAHHHHRVAVQDEILVRLAGR